MFWQGILNGLSAGWIYVLVALGLTLVFGIMRIVQFAHGEIYMLGSHVVFYSSTMLGVNIFISFVIAAVSMFMLGVIIERLLFRRFRGQIEPCIIVAIGLILLFQTTAVVAFGANEKNVPSLIPGVLIIGDLRIAWDRVLSMLVGFGFMLVLFAFIKGTKLGQAMLATSQDTDAATLQGINVNRISAITMGTGSALAAVAGGLMGSIFSVEPFMGSFAIAKGLAVIILGGLGSIGGAVAGGLILGLVDGIVPLYLSTTMAYIAGFALIVLILILRPKGLMGRD
ncbi:MAG: branched-chain amino acid ABC transporter permease [Deltaproteobacteria bacterium]|nr:branched-chain amino acid ABC transporter permease [Deltaproteobacteria bacterium]